MLGVAQVAVARRPRVAVISTGDELLPAEARLSPGKIRDANSYMLCGLVEDCGGQALNLGIVPDHPGAVLSALDQAIRENVDLIVSSAGVSVGALDFVRSVVETSGHLEFWRVNMRPGKPLAFGHYRNTPFFGLPGNPVSAFVGFEVFVRPALLKLQGLQALLRPTWRVRLLEPVESDGRESYLRAKVTMQSGEPVARLTGHQGSGNLHSLVQANALLLIPSGVKSLPSGGLVDAWMMTGELTR
jgi:molybdopterin molybdotransferase